MLKVVEINSMKEIREIIEEIIGKLNYSSPNKDIVRQMCSDTLELLFAYVLCVEEKERDIIEELSKKRPEPGWESFYDILMYLPIPGSFPNENDEYFYKKRHIKNELHKNLYALSDPINEIVLDADPELDDSKYPDDLLLTAFYSGERLCNVFPLSEYENDIITEYRFALMRMAKVFLDE